MSRLLRRLFVMLIAYPVALLWLGMLVRHRERLPLKGPAIIAANHNSHLDILALYSLFPLYLIPKVRPAAAADYFLKNRWLAWFSENVVGIVPVIRSRQGRKDPLDGCYAALERGEILIIFPEGTRGEPEIMADLKSGIWHLVKRFPEVQVTPVFMSGLGRSMPKGELFPLPLFVDVFVGKPLAFQESKHEFMQQLSAQLRHLRSKLVRRDASPATKQVDAPSS
ncbi:glycerol acyltransferase [Methylocaldum marinum]|uniref:Glycerol acyltransferase n=1 Tax=Methylocaldum marinum TaxID=1432792 RepID=A0A250KTD0_9GAMM|nr:lysophospholipid acyltransferase family protein [Methylocaldum marinum]BBA33039.1 glycerol acyltransferase [Methylocaldum marinum]